MYVCMCMSPRRLTYAPEGLCTYVCTYMYVWAPGGLCMYVYLCMYVCMHVCVYMYVCMYLSPLLQFHHGVFHNIFVAYSIMAYTQIATGLQVALRNNVLNVGVKIIQAV